MPAGRRWLARCFSLLMCSLAYPAAAQLQTPPPDCNSTPAYGYTIGTPSAITDYNAGGGTYTFAAGIYHVTGTIRFLNGTFIIKPGTSFYVDGNSTTFKNSPVISGYSLTIGKGAFLQADGALFTAACNTATPATPKATMWQGIRFESSQSGQRLHLGKNCTVAYAEYGVYVPPIVNGIKNTTQYEIWDCRFEQNLRHIADYGEHDGAVAPCSISHLTLYSQPSLLAPYQTALYDTWTIEALHLTPTGPVDNRPEILIDDTDRVRGGKSPNIIMGAVYGLVANLPGQGEIRIDGDLTVSRILRIGIWLDELTPIIAWGGNTVVDLHSFSTIYSKSYRSAFTAPGERSYGIVAAVVNSLAGPANSLSVEGVSGSDTTTFRVQTGAFISQVNNTLTRMNLTRLAFGMNLREGSQSIKGNYFDNCWHGVYIRPNATSYTIGFAIGCNTFGASSAGTSSAILVDPSAQLNAQGSIGNPMANKFIGYSGGQNSIMNRNPGNFLTYYRYQGSTDESATAITTGTLTAPTTTGQVQSTYGSYPLFDPQTNAPFCLASQGVLSGAQARGTSATSYLQALMDTVRRQAAPMARLRAYQAAIRQALLVERPDTAALETYVGTLATTNADAFYGLGLDLLEQYRRTARPRALARLRPALATRIGLYPAAAARLALFDVVSRVAKRGPNPRQPIAPADSLTLRRLARTPGGEAETAALWFNYLFPGVGLPSAAPRPGSPAAATPSPGLAPAGVRALYPNPATDRLRVECSVPDGAHAVVLRLTALLSGRVVLQTEVPSAQPGPRMADVDVRALPAGQYAAVLLIDGVPTTTQKVLVNR